MLQMKKTSHSRLLLLLIMICLLGSLAAQTAGETRVALVIGNGKYLNNTTLKNPVNDATDVAAALKATGFTVTLLVNAKRDAMEKAVRDFGNALKSPQTVGLFYYSGHGAQNEGQNYLLPVDADVQDADELRYKALDAESVLAKMRSSGNKLNMIFLDACRNNPFPGATRSAERGLSVVRVEVPESVIVYATSPGSVAQDGNGRNSPFTQAFLANMKTPGQDIAVMMKQVTGSVKQSTAGSQTPWISSNLTKDFSFVAAAGGSGSNVRPSPASSNNGDWGDIVVTPGALSLSVASAGTVTFNGKSKALPAGGSVNMAGIVPGDYPISIAYSDGKSESHTVQVEPGQTATVVFSYQPAPPAASAPVASSPDNTTADSLDIVMVAVPGGTYQMGGSTRTTVSSFSIGQTEVTQAQYQKVMGSNPAHFTAGAESSQRPVEQVSWYDAVAFCNQLSQLSGLSAVYTINGPKVTADMGRNGYRLPTEAEWELAARGGVQSTTQSAKYAGGDNLDEVAWHDSNSGKTTHPVATKKANDLGLFDMSGNVWEWCQDWYAYRLAGGSDPGGATDGPGRVLRGGSYSGGGSDDSVAVSFRGYHIPDFRYLNYGFRVVRR